MFLIPFIPPPPIIPTVALHHGIGGPPPAWLSYYILTVPAAWIVCSLVNLYQLSREKPRIDSPDMKIAAVLVALVMAIAWPVFLVAFLMMVGCDWLLKRIGKNQGTIKE